MAYISISLFVSLGVWLLVAVRSGRTDRADTLAGVDLRTGRQVSAHADARPARSSYDELADHRRAGHLAHDQQPARRLRVSQQEQFRRVDRGRKVRSHPVEIAA